MAKVNETLELTEDEKKLFELIEKLQTAELLQRMHNKFNVNVLNENSMTLVQCAAYRGNSVIVQSLIDHGADVNLCQHEHNYTALHFGALSGSTDVCDSLLTAGAKTDVKNSVGRTAAQMAAFVGNHACVALINNFVARSEIDAFTVSRDGSAPLLPPFLAESFHKFIIGVNIHPVRVALNVQNIVGLKDHLGSLKTVLNIMSQNSMKRLSEPNEVMAFKFHYLGYIISAIQKTKEQQDGKEPRAGDRVLEPIELFARKLLRSEREGRFDYMEAFLRECICDFPFRECTIFRQIVATLARSDSPSALNCIISGINGQRGFADTVPVCNSCGEETPTKKCSKCKSVNYCDRVCQRLHWSVHKKACTRFEQGLGLPEAGQAQATADPAEISAEIQNLLLSQ